MVIAGQECCSRIEPGQRSDVDTEYISRIAEELMVKEPKVKPLPSPKRPGDWPVEWPDGCAADNFRLAALSGNYSVTTLLNVYNVLYVYIYPLSNISKASLVSGRGRYQVDRTDGGGFSLQRDGISAR